MNKMNLRPSRHTVLSVAIAGAFALASGLSSAAPLPLNSGIDFNGGISPTGGTDVFNSTGWDIRTEGAASPGVAGTTKMTNTSSGEFAVFDPALCPAAATPAVTHCGTLMDLAISTTLPLIDFATFFQSALDSTDGFAHNVSFTLHNFTVTQSTLTNTLILDGLGVLFFDLYDPTNARFTLTAQGQGDTSFSASIRALGTAAAPEPASVLLLGGGLVGLAAIRRRKKLS